MSKFIWKPGDFTVTQCLSCRHFDRKAGAWKCAAFPSGIPDMVISNEVMHDKPLPGDHGLTYEKVDAKSTPTPSPPGS